MTKYTIILLTIFLTACSADKKCDRQLVLRTTVSPADSIIGVKRQELKPFVKELTRELKLPILSDTISLKSSDTTSFTEYRITLVSGGHSTGNLGCTFRVFGTNKNTFEAYTFWYNKNFSSPIIDSVKKLSNIILDLNDGREFYRLFDDVFFLDHSEFSQYSSTGGGHYIYEVFAKLKDQPLIYKRVVKTTQGLNGVNDFCFKKAGLDPNILYK